MGARHLTADTVDLSMAGNMFFAAFNVLASLELPLCPLCSDLLEQCLAVAVTKAVCGMMVVRHCTTLL